MSISRLITAPVSLEKDTPELFVCDARQPFAKFIEDQVDLDKAEIDDDYETSVPRNEISISALIDKIHNLSLRTRLQPPSSLTPCLELLDEALDNAFIELGVLHDSSRILPKSKRVAPHQGSGWDATKAVMGVGTKTKRPPKNPDPYAGREASGKQALPDAREPKRRKVEVTPHSSVSIPVYNPVPPFSQHLTQIQSFAPPPALSAPAPVPVSWQPPRIPTLPHPVQNVQSSFAPPPVSSAPVVQNIQTLFPPTNYDLFFSRNK
ncbi:hypothetical protein C8J56DRAFT_1052629 [Mycena floridula]|nr:hypothetical protein C8J56DRAFT_1052629 [Mycena floridula]